MNVDKLGPYLLGPNDDENCGIYTGDARELAKAIPDESVDLIFTDPVYDRIDDFRWLAGLGLRALKPDTALLTFCGIGYIPDTHRALGAYGDRGLQYRWRLVVRPLFGPGSGQWHGRLQAGTKELLWYEKGRSKLYASLFDCLAVSLCETAHRKVNGATWGKSVTALKWYVEAFSQPGGIVLDPFAGSGSLGVACKVLGRKYLAFEIDPAVAEQARQRVRETQPPLFVLEPEQLDLEMPE